MGAGRCNFCATTMEAKKLKRCGNCKNVLYCSKECQKSHWKEVHKAVCAPRALGEDPAEGEEARKVSRWVEAWSPAMISCFSIALDVPNHPWGRHKTHTLVVSIAHTDLDEDAQLFRVTEAALQPNAEINKHMPRLDQDSPDPPPELLGVPRIRCIFFVEDKDDPAKTERARIHVWGARDLRWMHSLVDKDYSRAIAGQAIPLLVSDINRLKKPEEAKRKLRFILGTPGVVVSVMKASSAGVIGVDEAGEGFRRRIEQLLDELGEGNDGPESRNFFTFF